VIQNQLHVQSAVGTESGNRLLRVENFHICICLDVAGGDNALPGGLDIDSLCSLAVETCDNALYVKNNFGHIFLYTGDSGKLMLYTGNLDAGACSTGKRRQKYPAKRVTKCCAVATLQRLYDIFAIRAVGRCFDALYTWLLNFDHIVI
jgi:hypothetical protein